MRIPSRRKLAFMRKEFPRASISNRSLLLPSLVPSSFNSLLTQKLAFAKVQRRTSLTLPYRHYAILQLLRRLHQIRETLYHEKSPNETKIYNKIVFTILYGQLLKSDDGEK